MEQIWIIRVKGHISGPFSTNEIMEMIESKKLSIKDEVNKPLKQWVYVKNTSELYVSSASQTATDVPAFKKRRSKQDWLEDTVILDSPAESSEAEDTKTAQVIEKENKEPLLQNLDLENAEVIDYKVDEPEDTPSPPESSVQFADIAQVKKKASIKSQKAVKYVWLLMFILCTGSLLFYFFNNSQQAKVSAVSGLSYGRKLFNQGNYAKALTLFKKAAPEKSSDLLKLASLLVQVEGDIYQAQINIEKIHNLSALEQSRLQILKGIIEYKKNNTASAENLFNAGLSLSPFLGTLHKVILNINNPEKALTLLNETNLKVTNANNRLLLLLKAYLEPPDTEEDHSALTNFLTSPQDDYKQEALLLLLNRQILTNNKEGYNETIKQVLDQDPYLTREYKTDILSYTPQFIWKELLLEICSNITQNHSNSYFIALKALCLIQSGQNTLALNNIEKARAQSPQDPLISSISAFVSSQNNLDEHTLVEHSLKQNQNYALPLILKARLCQKQKDIYCTHNHWSQVRQRNGQSLSAITGEAWSYSQMGNNQSAQDLIQTGFSLSNRYKPLIQLKDSL